MADWRAAAWRDPWSSYPRADALVIVAYVEQQPTGLLVPLTIASLTSIGHFLATSQAAPVMLSLRHTPDDETILTAKLDKFERWSAVRTTLQVLTFFVLIWALIVAC